MIDMKLTKSERKKDTAKGLPSTPSKPEYPYGLKVGLEKESLKKLGFKPLNFKLGQKVTISCEAEVTRLSMTDEMDYESNEVVLQITKMSLSGVKKGYDLGWDANKKDREDQLHKDGLI